MLPLGLALAAGWAVAATDGAAAPVPGPNGGVPPLGRLDPRAIPQEERHPWQPAERVAVLGEGRGRLWDHTRDACATFSPDGKWVASGAGGSIYLWEPGTLRLHAVLPMRTGYVSALWFTRDGRTLVANGSGGVAFWDLRAATPKEWDPFPGRPQPRPYALALSPDGRLLVSDSAPGPALWGLSVVPPRQRKLATGDGADLLHAAFSPNSRTLVTVTGTRHYILGFISLTHVSDVVTQFWDVKGGMARETAVLKGQRGGWGLGPLAFPPDGKTLLCGAAWYDLEEGKPKARGVFPKGDGTVEGLTFAPDGKTVLAWDSNGKLRVWDASGPRPRGRAVLSFPDGHVQAAALAPDGKTLAVVCGQLLRVWDFTGDGVRERQPPWGHTAAVTSLSFGAGDKLLATAGRDGGVRLWDLSGPFPRPKAVLPEKAWWDAVALSPDGMKLAAGSRYASLKLWYLAGPRQELMATHKQSAQALAFSPDSTTLAAAGDGGRVAALFDMAKPKGTAVGFDGDSGDGGRRRACPATALAFSPRGRLIACGGCGVVELWELADGRGWEPQAALETESDSVDALAFDQSGGKLAVACKRLQLWAVGKGKPVKLRQFEGHKEFVCAVALTPDGKTLASAGEGGEVIVWDATSGKKLRDWRFPGRVKCLAFASDGQHLATGNGNGTAYILRLALDPASRDSPKGKP
jgi:WD40 repeat protein